MKDFFNFYIIQMNLVFKNHKIERVEANSNHTVHLYFTDTESKSSKEVIIYEEKIKYLVIDDLDKQKKIHINMGDQFIEFYMDEEDMEEKYMKLINILVHK